MEKQSLHPEEPLAEDRVRAGHTGDGLLPILLVSLGLVVISFVVVLGGFLG